MKQLFTPDKKNMITLNPLQMTSSADRALLHALFTSNKLCLIWEKNKTYRSLTQDVELTHTISLQQLTTDHVCYHVIANESLDAGHYGTVYAIACTFSFLNEEAIEYMATEPLVAKQLSIRPFETVEIFKTRVERESTYCQIATHLHAEPPVYNVSGRVALLPMKKMPGMQLFDVLKLIYNENRRLSWKFLYQLTNALLKAFNEQVVTRGISHRDIKPENIFCYFGLNKDQLPSNMKSFVPDFVEMYLIDYGFGLKFGETISKKEGTPDYVAPEILSGARVFYDEKPDIYAIGIILGMMWGFHQHNPTCSTGQVIRERYDLFFASQAPDFSIQELTDIHTLITKMVRKNPNDRWSLAHSTIGFDDIIQRYHATEAKVLFDQANQYGEAHLHRAACYGYQAMIRRLITQGIDLNARTTTKLQDIKYANKTAMDLACLQNRDAIVILLFEAGAQVSPPVSGQTHPIHIFSKHGLSTHVQTLIEHDSELIHLQDNSCSPLDWAIINGHAPTIALLIGAGASTKHLHTKIGNKTLCQLKQVGDLDTANLLIKINKALLNQRNQHGYAPLQCAALSGNIDRVRYLVSQGADVNIRTPETSILYPNKTTLDILLLTKKYNPIAVFLLEAGANISPAEAGHFHVIHLAARNGLIELVKSLIEQNPALIDLPDQYNQTALLWAASRGHHEIVAFLISKGAKINIATQLPASGEHSEENNRSPLDWAIIGGHASTITHLIKAGAVANVCSKYNQAKRLANHLITHSLFRPEPDGTDEDIDDLSMARCAFGQGSNRAKAISQCKS